MRAPCTLCLCHVEVAQEVLSFARSAWTKIRTLKCGCSPGCHQAQLRSPTGQAGEWGSSHTFLRHRQRDYSGSGSCDISAKLLYPEPKHRGHVALREGHHLLLKVNQVVTSNPLLSRDSHFLGCIWMQESWRTPWKTKESMSNLCLKAPWLTPHSLRPKSASGMSWSSDSSCYLSFRDKTVTHWIFKSFPCEPSMLLSKHSALS